MSHVTDELVPVTSLLRRADESLRRGESAAPEVWPMGFPILDTYLGGGLRTGELTLLGGPQGLGKTTFALQVVRNLADVGRRAMYFSFEHDGQTLLERLICVEAGASGDQDSVQMRRVRTALESTGGSSGLAELLSDVPGAADAVRAVESWGDRVLVQRASGEQASLDSIRQQVLAACRKDAALVVIDYLQKVAVPDGPPVEDERVTIIVEGLKDLAMEAGVPVLAVVAADKQGLAAGRRLRVQHLRGSSALAYEADVVLLLNDKYDVVARHHLVYDVTNAERFRDWAVLSIEKNRGGLARIDMEFRKHFAQARFDSDGQLVREQLVDERVFAD